MINYNKEKVCRWHDDNRKLYSSIITNLRNSKNVTFEGLCHIYDYAMMLLLGVDFKPIYDPNNNLFGILSKNFNDWWMSKSIGFTSMILNTSTSLKVVDYLRKTDNRECMALYWLVEDDLYEMILGRMKDYPLQNSNSKRLKAIERKMIEESLNHGIKSPKFWKELYLSSSKIFQCDKYELSMILKPWDSETDFISQSEIRDRVILQESKPAETIPQDKKPTGTSQEAIQEPYLPSADETNPIAPEAMKPSVDAPSKNINEKVQHISTLFISDDMGMNQCYALSLYNFIQNTKSSKATIAAIYFFESKVMIIKSSFRKIHNAIHADIINSKAYSTLVAIYHKYHQLTQLKSLEEVYFKFTKEDEKTRENAKQIFMLMRNFDTFLQSSIQT